MASNVSVKISADVSDLEAKSAIARAELSAVSREMNKLAREAVSGGMTDALNAQVVNLAESVTKAKANVASLKSALQNVGAADSWRAKIDALKSAQNGANFQADYQSSMRIGVAATDNGASFQALDAQLSAESENLQARARQMGENFRTAFNESMRIGVSASDNGASYEAMAQMAREEDQMAAEAAALRAQVDPLATAQANLTASTSKYNSMLRAGLLTEEQHTRALSLAQQRYDAVAAAARRMAAGNKLNSFQAANLTYQVNDVVSGLAMGQSAMTVFTQQAGQIYQIFAGQGIGVKGALQATINTLKGMLSPAMIAAGGLAAVGAGAYYLISEHNKLTQENQSLASSFRIVGSAALSSAENVGNVRVALAALPGMSDEASQSLLKLAAAHPGVDVGSVNQVAQLMGAFGGDADAQAQQAGQLLNALSDLSVSGFQQLNRSMLALEPAEYARIENMIREGQTAQAVQEILQQLASKTGTSMQSIGDQHYAARMKVEKLKTTIAELTSFGGALFGLTLSPIFLARISKAEKGLKGVEAEANKLNNTKINLQISLDNDFVQSTSANLDKNISRQATLDRLTRAYKEDQKKAAQFRKEADATGDSKKADDLRKQAAEYDKLAAKAKAASEAQVAANKKQDNQAATSKKNTGWQAFLQVEQVKIQTTREGSAERLAIEQQVAARAKATWGTESRQYADAQSAMARTKIAAENNALTITRSKSQADIAVLRSEMAQKKLLLDDEVSQNQISKAEELRVLDQYAEEIYQKQRDLDEKELAAARAKYAAKLQAQQGGAAPSETQVSVGFAGTSEYAAGMSAMKTLTAQWESTHAGYMSRIAQATRDAANDGADAWRTGLQTIQSAESSLVSGIFAGRQTLSQMLVSIGLQTAEREVAADVTGMTARLMLSKTELAQNKHLGQMGALYHILFENKKTVGTSAGVASRTALEKSESSGGILSQIGSMLAKWLGFETAKTASTAAQTAARATTEETTLAAQAAAQAPVRVSLAMGDAAVAAAGALAAMSAIPIVGPALGAVAAAETYAQGLAYAGMAAYAGGTNSAAGGMALVGENGPELVNVPRGAAVIPNHKILSAVNTSSSSVTSNASSTSLNYAPTINGQDTTDYEKVLQDHASTMYKVIRRGIRTGALKVSA